ncbi:hypothetical protein CHRYSEO8AT_360011 [Chryseobacterium sp. 8AT]|nr:hypothetical protein CHRYSEO8AT_360011 [Chryseobacterium sp. 8AT]
MRVSASALPPPKLSKELRQAVQSGLLTTLRHKQNLTGFKNLLGLQTFSKE